ncbi:MAG: nucleotide exchange factor GrpE [Actinomycetes bacterium]
MSNEESEDTGVRITDKRRIDPETFEVRQQETAGVPEEGFEVEGFDAEFDEVESKVAELTGDLQRVHAEYANYRKRVDRDRELIRETAVGGVLTGLLPILDDIERAREHGELEGAFKSVGETLQATCAKLGLETFGEANEPFDPSMHEALTSESNDAVTEPTVISVYQSGYRYAGRVLRPARVAVAGTD